MPLVRFTLARSTPLWVAALSAFALASAGCAVVGETGSCDARAAASARASCHELVESVVLDRFKSACESKGARYAEATCPRAKALGGCAQNATNEDGSLSVEWFYDPKGDPKASRYPAEDTARTVDDVKRFCSDPKRYDEPRHFVTP